MGAMSGVDALDDLFARVHLRTLEPVRIILAGAFNDIATSSRTATGSGQDARAVSRLPQRCDQRFSCGCFSAVRRLPTSSA